MPAFLALREDPKWAEVSSETMTPSIQSSGVSRSEVAQPCLRSSIQQLGPRPGAHPFLRPEDRASEEGRVRPSRAQGA